MVLDMSKLSKVRINNEAYETVICHNQTQGSRLMKEKITKEIFFLST